LLAELAEDVDEVERDVGDAELSLFCSVGVGFFIA